MNNWKKLWILLSIVWAVTVITAATFIITQGSIKEPTRASLIAQLSEDSKTFYENLNPDEEGPAYTVTLTYEDGVTQEIQFPLLTEDIKDIDFKKKLENLAGKNGKKISNFEIEKFSKNVTLLNSKALKAKTEYLEKSARNKSDNRNTVILYSIILIIIPLLIILWPGYGVAWARMKKSTHQNQIIQTQRTISFSPNEIYAAFSDPVRLANWWGPKDFKNTFETFEFKTNGSWKFVMHSPDGHNYPNESVFNELIADERIVIQHISAPRFTLTISLLPNKEGTLLKWIQNFEDTKVADAIRHIAEPGNEQNLDRLEMHLRGELI